MNLLEDVLDKLSTRQRNRIRAAWASLQEGLISRDEFIHFATNIVLAGNAVGYRLGTLTVRHLIEQAVGIPEVTPFDGSIRHLDAARIEAALGTILDDDQDTLMQLDRLLDNEPKQAAADGTSDVLRRSRRVKGWVRTLDSNACQLCVWWWREGRVWQPDHPMPRHTGCTCMQTPITKKTDNYQTERQARERQAE